MELIVQWLLWTLAYIFFVVELNLYLDYDWRRKNKPRAEKLAHLIAYFGWLLPLPQVRGAFLGLNP